IRTEQGKRLHAHAAHSRGRRVIAAGGWQGVADTPDRIGGADAMDIHEHQHGAVTVLKPEGALSQGDADQLRQRLATALEKSLGRLVLDLSGVPFVDSQGLEVLVDTTEELAE